VSPPPQANPSTRLARDVVATLVGAGVEEFVLAPGSRSAPLAFAAYDAALRKRYVASKRHTIQVDAHTYRSELERERRTRRRDA